MTKAIENKSVEFNTVLFFQITGFYEALITTAANKESIGKSSIELARKFRKEVLTIASGENFKDIPEIASDTSLGDLIILFGTLLFSLQPFLKQDQMTFIDKTLDRALKVKQIIK